MIVCVCRRVSDSTIRAAVQSGARTAEDVARATGAGTSCRCCVEQVEALARSSHASPCSDPPCAGCPRRASAAA